MDRAELAEDVPLADFQKRRLAAVLEVLRLEADGGVGEELVARANLARAVNRRVMTDAAAVAELDLRGDDGVGTNLHAGTEPRLEIDEGRGMNLGITHELQRES